MTHLRKLAVAGIAAITLSAAIAPDAEAQRRRHYRGGAGAAVAAGILGGALLGAAMAPRPTYGAPIYGAPGYVYDPAPPPVYYAPPPPPPRVYYAPPRRGGAVLISQTPTRNCVINTYQDAYGRQFSRKVCPRY